MFGVVPECKFRVGSKRVYTNVRRERGKVHGENDYFMVKYKPSIICSISPNPNPISTGN